MYLTKLFRPKPRIKLLTKDEKERLINYQKGETCPCVIHVNTGDIRKRIYRDIPNEDIPIDSVTHKKNGVYLHWLGLDRKTGKYWPIFESNGNGLHGASSSPLKLSIATKKPEKFIPILFRYSTPTIEKLKIGILIVFCFVELIVLFFIITSVGGNTGVA